MKCRFTSWHALYQADQKPVARPVGLFWLSSLSLILLRLQFVALYLGVGFGEETLSFASISKHKVPSFTSWQVSCLNVHASCFAQMVHESANLHAYIQYMLLHQAAA